MKIISTIFLLLFITTTNGQDLSGTWEGTGGMGAPYLKMVIVKNGKEYIGYTYDDGSIGYCKANFLGRFDSSSKKLKGKGMGFIEKTFGHGQCVFNLNYSKAGKGEFLRGMAWPKSIVSKIFTLGIPGIVSLTKVSDTIDTTAFVLSRISDEPINVIDSIKDDTIIALEQYDELEKNVITTSKQRTDDTLSTIVVTGKNILLRIFDNGITDGDSISVLYNNKLVASKIEVTAKLVEIPLLIEDSDSNHKITLVAHNLGSIPPNTATIVIEAGDKKYTLFASSDLKKNASIIIRYRE